MSAIEMGIAYRGGDTLLAIGVNIYPVYMGHLRIFTLLAVLKKREGCDLDKELLYCG